MKNYKRWWGHEELVSDLHIYAWVILTFLAIIYLGVRACQ